MDGEAGETAKNRSEPTMRDHLRAVSEDLLRYTRQTSLRETDIQRRLREETATQPEAGFAAAPEQSQFLAFLIEMMDARRVLEVGIYTGYSTLAMAMALPTDGHLFACDMMEEYVAVGRPYWEEAGVAPMIETQIGAAADILNRLISEGRAASYDFAFIDCNKKDYDTYFELTMTLVRPGGVIAFDNVYQSGRVLDPATDSKGAITLRKLNEKLHHDERVSLTMLPVEDGMTLVRKRG